MMELGGSATDDAGPSDSDISVSETETDPTESLETEALLDTSESSSEIV